VGIVADSGLNIVNIAGIEAKRRGTDIGTELTRLEDELRVKRELAESKKQPGRQAAEKAASTSVKEGVKTTVYPYVEPRKNPTARPGGGAGAGNLDERGFAKGGSASSRADGCAKRGKTRGKML